LTTRGPIVRDLREPISTPADGIVSRAIHDDENWRVVLFSFAPGQQLSDHTASTPAIIEIVEGEADLTVAGDAIDGRPGTWLHMEAETPHGIVARTPLTLLLTLLKQRG
jgi:quercetin dioxygenase-like cupin family protein